MLGRLWTKLTVNLLELSFECLADVIPFDIKAVLQPLLMSLNFRLVFCNLNGKRTLIFLPSRFCRSAERS